MAARPSALSEALARIGDRWSLLLVEALLDAPQRFADLEEAVAGISTNILTARLRHLEAEGVVLAVPYSHRPLRYSYELTEVGRGLAGAVRMLSQWSVDHGTHAAATAADHPPGEEPVGTGTGGGGGRGRGRAPRAGGAPVHDLCGTPMEAVWWCPTCEQVAGRDPGEAVWV